MLRSSVFWGLGIVVATGWADVVGFAQGLPDGGADRPTATRAPRRDPEALRFAHGLLRRKEFELAAAEYERFLAAHPAGPDRLDALFGLANARLDQGRYADALGAFRRFLEGGSGDPRSRTARYRLGELSYLTGDLAGARQALEAFTADRAAHPALETAWAYLGDVCFAMNDMPAARSAYERSLTDFPRGRLAERARYGLARALAAQGDRDRALRLLRELAQGGGPEWVDRAYLQIGSIELAAGHTREAVAALEGLERAVPGSRLKGEARLRRARALRKLGRDEEAVRLLRGLSADGAGALAAEAALELGTIELERDRPGPALSAVDAALGRADRPALRAALLFRSGEALRRLKRPEEAEARFLQVVEVAPEDPWADDAQYRASASALDRKDAAAARRLAAAFATRFPQSPLRGEVRLVEARAAAMAGDYKGAAGLLESITEGPAPPAVLRDARYELALAYRALGRSVDAEKLLARLAEEPDSPVAADAGFLLGQSRLEAGRPAEAIAPLERYLAADPRGEVAEFALADLVAARLGAGKSEEADRALEELARRFPEGKALPRARLRVAEAALAGGHPERAVELFRLVAGPGRGPGSSGNPPAVDAGLRARALAGLGRALEASGHADEAARALDAAMELAPSAPSAPETALARARALEAANRPDDALNAYAEASRRFAGRDEGLRAAVARARLLAKLGRHGAAAADYERLIGDPAAREGLARIGATPDAMLAELGWSLVDASKPAEADRAFARLLKEYPTSPRAVEARFNLAESANQARDYAEVIRLLGPLAAGKGPATSGPSPPSDPAERLMPAVLYRLGRTQVELRDWPSAASTLDRLLAEFPENPYRREARFLRAEAALQLGDPAAAGSGFAALLSEPGRPEDAGFRRSVRLEQVRCWVALKRWKEIIPAVAALRGELKPDDPAVAELDYARGQAEMGLGRMDDARKSFQAVIAARREGDLPARAQLMLGESYFHEDRLREALREFLRVDIMYKSPRWQAAALLEIGKVYERLDRWADAAEAYQGLVARFPEDPEAATARTRGEAARRRAGQAGPASGTRP